MAMMDCLLNGEQRKISEYQLNKITFWQLEIVPLLKRNQFLILLENQRFSYIGE